MDKILGNLVKYLENKIENFKTDGAFFTCPICEEDSRDICTCEIVDNQVRCVKCGFVGSVFDLLRKFHGYTLDDEDIALDLSEEMGIKLEDDVEKILKFYSDNGFDLIPIVKNSKVPNEKDFWNKPHKNITEWRGWVRDGLNFGIKTGVHSNVTVIDFDEMDNIPEEFTKHRGDPLIERTRRGWHYYYKYEKDLPDVKLEKPHLEILNGKFYSFCSPSVCDNIKREFVTDLKLTEMPEELKKYLLSISENKKKTDTEEDSKIELIKEEILTGNFKIDPLELKNNNLDGCCNNAFIKLGGVLRKQLNKTDTAFVLHLLNKHLLADPMNYQTVNAMLNSLETYRTVDHSDLHHKILDYMKKADAESSSKDIQEVLVEKKEIVDEALSYLAREGYLLKKGNGRGVYYKLIKKMEWRTEFVSEGHEVDYKVPYVHDYAVVRNGDMIIFGGIRGSGKTHLAINIIKNLKEQKKVPNYICLEAGSRFVSIANQLGLKEGDFKWCVNFNPQEVELEENAITIIDWLLPDDYAQTDKLFKYFAEQLAAKGGVLIIFVQLKEKGEWFACVDDKTELLTDEGWKLRREIKKNNVIACFDPKDESIFYEKPKKINEYDYDNYMVKIEDDYFSQLLTPNHNMLLKYRRQHNRKKLKWWDKSWLFSKAGDLSPHGGFKIPLSGYFDSNYSIGKDLVRLIGWILTEGTYDKKRKVIRITQSNIINPTKVNKIRKSLNNLKIKFSESIREDGVIRFYLKRGYGKKLEYIYKIIWEYMDSNKNPSYKLLTLKKEELKILFDTLIDGDGTKITKKSWQFYQKNKKFIDWFQILCCHLGYRTLIRKYKNTGFNVKGNNIFHVQIFKQNWRQVASNKFKNTVSKVLYKGKVWCPTVSTGAFVARREDKIFITGNSNMIEMFPAVAVKFLYDNETNGQTSNFLFTKRREPRSFEHVKKLRIPSYYDTKTKELKIKGDDDAKDKD